MSHLNFHAKITKYAFSTLGQYFCISSEVGVNQEFWFNSDMSNKRKDETLLVIFKHCGEKEGEETFWQQLW